MSKAKIGVIGGSGLYQIAGLSEVEEVSLSTPFGDPSDSFFIGTLAGERVAFLPRHGRGHTLLPTEIPFLANIYRDEAARGRENHIGQRSWIAS
jgi:5'-methylthioadenosine phosphorylase